MSETLQWKKLGKIFEASKDFLPRECFGFAQSPQALVFDDYVRIYFSTRQRDGENKFLSQVGYIDMSKDLSRLLDHSTKPVIPLGAPGTFDEHGIFPFSPFRSRRKTWAYTCGWSRRVSVPVETSTGLLLSEDNGKTYSKLGPGPVFSSSLHEPFLVGDSFVRVVNDRFHMWYIYGTQWKNYPDEPGPARVYKIAHAISDDGISWTRDGKQIIKDKLGEEECQALPTVTWFNDRYHMFFCYRHSTGFRKQPERGYRIGYAYSDNMIEWTRDDDMGGLQTTAGDWDSDMMCYPHVFSMDGRIYILYNGNEFGKDGFGAAVLTNQPLVYQVGEASTSQVISHLKECDSSFIPPLSERLSIDEYGKKLYNLSTTFEAWAEGKLVGLIAAYLNEIKLGIGFITSVSVSSAYAGKGIGKKLLLNCMKNARDRKFQAVRLEVNEKSAPAIAMYEKLGFSVIDKIDSQLIMQTNLQ
jgi:ribosomal protein S18 acetylase RimI-like enzyme